MALDRITPEQRHELDVIDAAVRGGGEARPQDASLTDLALLVRAARPLPDHGATMRLDERLASRKSVRPPKRSLLGPAAAGLASLIVLVGAGVIWSSRDALAPDRDTIAVQEFRDGGESFPNPDAANGVAVPPSGEKMAVPESAPSSTAESELDTGVAGGGLRRVARDAQLVLAAPAERIQRLADSVNAIADESGGWVQDARVSVNTGKRAHASFLMMIPARTYQETLARLSRVAHVRSRSQGMTDITTAYNAAERALARSRARVRELERKLAATPEGAARKKVEHDLTRARLAERQATRAVRGTRSRVRYVPLSLRIVADRSAANAGQGTIARAMSDARSILTGMAAVLIVALAILLPISLVALIAWWGVRRHRRGRDEATLARSAAQSE